jgi:hypothetical protein
MREGSSRGAKKEKSHGEAWGFGNNALEILIIVMSGSYDLHAKVLWLPDP